MGLPTAAQFAQNRVTNPNQSEVLRQRLYDHLIYPGAGTLTLAFFQAGINQGIGSAPGSTAGNPKTVADTNLDLGGQLPSGKGYNIETIEVYFYPGSVSTTNVFTPVYPMIAALATTNFTQATDAQAFYNSGVLQFKVLDKDQLVETPLRSFPPKTQMMFDVSLAAAANSTAAISSTSAYPSGRPYILEPQISLQAAVNFKVNLNWPGLVAMPSGFNARVGVYFDGTLMRAAQ